METGQPSILMEILSQRAIAAMVMLLGMVIAIAKYRKFPGPSRLVLLGTGLLLFPTIGSAFSYRMVLDYLESGVDDELFLYRGAIHLMTILTRTVGMLCLIAAAYYQRDYVRPRRIAASGSSED